MINWRRFVDPDNVWFASDKYQHGGSWFVLTLFQLWIGLVAWQTLVVCAVGGVIYELGQTDTAFNSTIIDKRTGVSALGTPGFGISPLDLAWNLAGAILGNLIWLFLS